MLIPKLIALVLSVFVVCEAGMTVEQMKKSGKVVRVACMQKLKIADDRLNELEKGEFPDEKDLKCYSTCLLETMNVLKKGKMNYDGAIKQSDIMMPDTHKESAKNALTVCRDVPQQYNDNCSAAYALFECLYKNNPNFFFP